jgi:hypothetical protein
MYNNNCNQIDLRRAAAAAVYALRSTFRSWAALALRGPSRDAPLPPPQRGAGPATPGGLPGPPLCRPSGARDAGARNANRFVLRGHRVVVLVNVPNLGTH